MANLGALAAGLGSSAIVVAILVGFERLTDFDLFSLTFWLVVPAGAFVTGLLAASGYYFGAIMFNARPSRVLAVGMLVVAALTQFAMYYARYAIDVTQEGTPVRDLIGFAGYVAFVLSHARYGLHSHGVALGTGFEVGALGYVIAVLQFIALLCGGFGVYALLADRPYCEPCARYARSKEKRDVALPKEFAPHLARLRAVEPLSSEYDSLLQVHEQTPEAGMDLEILECVRCGRRAVVEQPKVLADGKWSYQGASYRTAWTAAVRPSSVTQQME